MLLVVAKVDDTQTQEKMWWVISEVPKEKKTIWGRGLFGAQNSERGGRERGFSSGKTNLLHVPTTLFIVTFQVGAWARSRLLGTLIYCQCMYRKSMVQSI